MLTIGTEVIVHFRTRPVAEGTVTFYGIGGEQIKWGGTELWVKTMSK